MAFEPNLNGTLMAERNNWEKTSWNMAQDKRLELSTQFSVSVRNDSQWFEELTFIYSIIAGIRNPFYINCPLYASDFN